MFIGLYVLLFTAYGAASSFSRPGASSMLAMILFAGLGTGGALAGLTSYILSVILFSSLWGKLRMISGDSAINGSA